jgi:erythromycin esterase-like protein
MNQLYTEDQKIKIIRDAAIPLKETGDEYLALVDLVGDATVVMLGECSHGSHEFYRERAQITKQLIRLKGFRAIAIEGDWPDANRIHNFVAGISDDEEAVDALRGFTRFPSWMWANADCLDFIGWLREFNDNLDDETRAVGFYGLDLYSLFRSIQEVIGYLDQVDPPAAKQARLRYACLDRFNGDSQSYAYATKLGLSTSCEEAVVAQLTELLKNAPVYIKHVGGDFAMDTYFNAQQNSRLVRAAENYYRTMLQSDISSWNLRDAHMGETLQHIRQHLIRRGEKPKVVIWAHNSHVGDARATDMARRSEFNIGQLAREAYGKETVSIGFTTYGGTVMAASEWDGVAERKTVRPALPGSYENLFHRTGISRMFLKLGDGGEVMHALREPMLERAIGVIYKPETERLSHYFFASLSSQFDAVIHFDHTRAVEPLEHETHWQPGNEAPETYPSGM